MLLIFEEFLLAGLALALLLLAWRRPQFRFTWLAAVGGALLSWLIVLGWQSRLPLQVQLPSWEPAGLFPASLAFTIDGLTWPLAFSLATLLVAVMLTAVVRENYPAPLPWAGIFGFTGLGILAVLAENALTLLMVWAAIDLAEVAAQLRQGGLKLSSKDIMTVFGLRLAGLGTLLWAGMVSLHQSSSLDFSATPPEASIFLLVAAAFRLGVLPMHVADASEVDVRRGFGSVLRLVSAAASLALLARTPVSDLPVTGSLLLALAAVTAMYASWMWFRSPDELGGRPYWLAGFAGLAMISALSGNPTGAVAWGCGLILAGGVLFLSSAYQPWVNRSLWAGLWGISALPFSLTAAGSEPAGFTNPGIWIAVVFSLACLLAGFARHAVRPALRTRLSTHDRVSIAAYLLGTGLLIGVIGVLGVWGWAGALKVGSGLPAMVSTLMAGILYWSVTRFRFMAPLQARPLGPFRSSWSGWLLQAFLGVYRLMRDLSRTISLALEGEGGIMWTLLFLVVMITIFSQGLQAP